MCGGVKFKREGEEFTIYFPNPKAVLPVRLKSGKVMLVPWGRRNEQPGKLPQTGWARHDSIKAGKWDYYIPKPVLIVVDAFMEKDNQKQSHWYPKSKGSYIQGLLASDGDERRVYVVTIDSAFEDKQDIHDRWPRIVLSPSNEASFG